VGAFVAAAAISPGVERPPGTRALAIAGPGSKGAVFILLGKGSDLRAQGQRGQGLLCGMCSPKHIILKLNVEILVSKS
jgi:hypothetical protein